MQELTNDYYSEIKIHNIFHIAYKAIEFSTIKKEPTIIFPIPILEWQRGSPCHGGFVHKANGMIVRNTWGYKNPLVISLSPDPEHLRIEPRVYSFPHKKSSQYEQ